MDNNCNISCKNYSSTKNGFKITKFYKICIKHSIW